MIYKSFFKRKVTKIYLFIFIIFSIVLSFLFLAKNYMIIKGNEAYRNSFIYFVSDKNIDFTEDKNIKEYNKAFELGCNNQLSDVFVTKGKPIIEVDTSGYSRCIINEYNVDYNMVYRINIIHNDKLYDELDKEMNEYYYFISLNNWFDAPNTIEELSNKYKVDIMVEENKIDSNNYKNVIFIFELFMKVVAILFVILFIISVINIIMDEKKNNKLYYSLGYSKMRIVRITINKILLLLIIPIFIMFLSFMAVL